MGAACGRAVDTREPGFAQAQRELAQAKGWLGELKRRVVYSDFAIGHAPSTTPVRAGSRFARR